MSNYLKARLNYGHVDIPSEVLKDNNQIVEEMLNTTKEFQKKISVIDMAETYVDNINGEVVESNINDKLNYLNQTKLEIADAIKNKGGIVTPSTSFRDYGLEINKIKSTDVWEPNPTWWDIEKIIREDDTPLNHKLIVLINDFKDSTTFHTGLNIGDIIKTSDGCTYTYSGSSIIHFWDKNFDLDCYDLYIKSNMYKTRYYIVCSNNINIRLCYNNDDKTSIVYFVASSCVVIPDVGSSRNFSNYSQLRSYSLIDSSLYIFTNSGAFLNCYSLEHIPDYTIKINDIGYQTFSNCYSLRSIPQFIMEGTITTLSDIFYKCYSLRKAKFNPSKSNLTLSGTANNIVNECYTLEYLILPSRLNLGYNTFSTNYKLSYVSFLPYEEIISFDGNWNINSYGGIRYFDFGNNIVTSSLSVFRFNSSLLDYTSIISLLNCLIDLSGKSTKTLDLGANINKISDAEKLIGINKNWTIV